MTDLKPGVAQLARAIAHAAPSPLRQIALPERNASLIFDDPQPLVTAYRHAFAVGDGIAVLDIPAPTADWLLGPLETTCPADPLARGMLLELALLDCLKMIEAALGTAIQPTDAQTPKIGFGVEITTGEGTAHSLLLHLSEPLARALGKHLESSATSSRLPDPSQLKVPLTLRHGQQFLSDVEIASLATGDVIMLEPGPALLLASGDYAASVELSPEGPRLRSDLMPLPIPPDRAHRQIEVVAARGEMDIASLNALAPGEVIGIAAFSDAAADLVIAGRTVGRGALITIGEGAGVRILNLFDTAAE